MTAAVAERASGRGRQPAAIERSRDLLDELVAQTHENRVFAERVAAASGTLRRAHVLDRWDLVEATAGELGYHAERQITRLGSVIL